ncbi:AEC family transporter [Shimia sp. MMG029]|uniref:AEC family transporter n=1 Tax=Shimia sp. MMG029 TaxID=3021978 RepID=UPI0022FDC3F9|nr:AEC family transporter [Shimia sp. MMG029]MDA5555264.1 AEC family transporter [Shimia sp. MMG029]
MTFVAILIGLLPSFLLVGLGAILRPRLSLNAWQGLDKLNFEILFPALLFVAASQMPLELTKVVSIAPIVWLLLAVGLAVGYLARSFGPEVFRDFAAGWQTSWRFNTALAFIAVATTEKAGAGEMAVVVGMGVPMANALAVIVLSRGESLGLWGTVRKVALNPFLLASLSGVVVGLSGLRIPGPVLAPLEMLSAAAIPIALISVGATMNWGALARLDRFSGLICTTKLIVMPACALGLAVSLGLESGVAAALVIWAALPTASAAHVLAAGFGADRELAATLVAQTTLLGAASLTLWITLVEVVF